VIRKITIKDKLNFCDYCIKYGQNLFIDSSFEYIERIFNRLTKLNYFCIVDEEYDNFRGILFIEKINNDFYVKTIYKNPKVLDRLLRVLVWNAHKDVILKINDYKVVSVLKKYFFRLKSKTEKEYIYFRKYFNKVNKNGKL